MPVARVAKLSSLVSLLLLSLCYALLGGVHLAAASKVPVSLATTEFRAEEASRGAADELEAWALREQDENFASVHKNNPGSLGVILAGNVNEHEGVIETILSSHKYLNRALSREKGNGRTVRIDASASRDVIDAVFRGLKIRCEGMCVDEHTCELPWTVVYIRRAEKVGFYDNSNAVENVGFASVHES